MTFSLQILQKQFCKHNWSIKVDLHNIKTVVRIFAMLEDPHIGDSSIVNQGPDIFMLLKNFCEFLIEAFPLQKVYFFVYNYPPFVFLVHFGAYMKA